MAKYEWEYGSLILPSKVFPGFIKKLVEKENIRIAEAWAAAKEVYGNLAELGATGKSLKGDKANELLTKAIQASKLWSQYLGKFPYDANYELLRAFGLESVTARADARVKFSKPKKSKFLPVKMAAKGELIDPEGEAIITWDRERREVSWNVPENNHARDSARRGDFGKAFFQALREVQWTRGSGGVFMGNDEYNRKAGMGSNYVTAKFGPAGKDVINL